jgi:hypothetical protein
VSDFPRLKVLSEHVDRDDRPITFDRHINPAHVKWVENQDGRCILQLTEGDSIEVIGQPAEVAKRLAIAQE